MPTDTPPALPAALSIPEAAKRLSISRAHVYNLIDRGEIRRVKLGRRALIPVSEIERVLADVSDRTEK